jgi:N4-gp56 family major capsid protein
MANSVSIDALRPELWQKALYEDVMRGMYFTANGLMGEDENNIIYVKNDLMKNKGDTVTVGLTTRLTGAGVSGDNELEGNEEAISAYSESIAIDQKRFAVRLTGALDEQKNAYDMRMDAKNKLSIRLQEFIERQMFFKLGGCANTTLNDVNGVVVGADVAWSNTPDDFATSRYICANASGGASLSSTDLITPELISKARIKAVMAEPKIQPLKIKGENFYVCFVHPWQAYDLRNNATFSQARREAEVRGKDNPIFTGALGVWDGVIIKEHEYVPFLDVSIAGNNFYASGSGTDFAVDTCRALLCGRQAAAFAKAKMTKGWVEKSFDYENKTGCATGLIGGIQKVMFNSKSYGVVAIDTAVTDLSA